MSDALLRFTAPIEIQAAGGGSKTPRASIVAYSGGPMSVPGFGRVVIDLAGLDASASIPLLADHENSLAGIVGHGVPVVDGGRLLVNATLADTSAAKQIIELAKSGFPFQASVGVEPTRSEFIRAGDVVTVNGQSIKMDAAGFTLIRAGHLREVSITPAGADSSTSVSVAASLSKGLKRMSTQHDDTLSPENIARVNASLPDDMRLPWDRSGMTDDQRVEARLGAFRRDYGDVLPDFGDGMIRAAATGSLTWGDAEREILRGEVRAMKIRSFMGKLPKGPMIQSSTRDIGGGSVLEGALLCHLGHEHLSAKLFGDQVTQSARSMGLHSLHDILRAGLQREGMTVPSGREEMIRASFSTIAVSGILSNAANKISQEAYTAAPSVARVVAKKLSANDFKMHTGYRMTANATFEEVPPAGEIKHGQLGESSYTYQVDTYARMFGLTRQDVVNDDLGKFEEVPRLLGRGAANKLEQLFWTLVLANTGSFFHADNNNYISGANSALGITGLGLAVEALRKLVDANGDPISITPKYLVVPPELEAVADALYASTNVLISSDVAVPDSNPYKGKYQPQVSPYLSNANYSGYSATGWYLFGEPADVPAFGIAYLNGQESPMIEQQDADFNKLGIQFRGVHDMAVCQIDPAGGIMSKGTS